MSGVVVLGGGPAGLFAALRLARRGIPVVVLERERHVGGLAAGTRVDGMPVDFGSHRLHPSTRADILSDLRRILGDDLQERSRRGRIRIADRWVAFPLRPWDLVRNLPPAVLARLTWGAATAPRPASRITYAEVVAGGLGRTMGELFYYPYAEKVWGLPADRLSAEHARRRIGADRPGKLIGRVFRPRNLFFYPRGGFGRIPRAIADAAVSAGAELITGAEVVGLRRGGDRWVVETSVGDVEGGVVLSTIPMPILARLLDPPPALGGRLELLSYRSMVLVYLVAGVPRWTEFDAHYFPGREVPFTRVSEPKNYRDDPDDPEDRTVLCIEIPCTAGDEVWSSPDQTLVAKVRRALVTVGLPDSGSVGRVHRIGHAYPVYRVGADRAAAEVEAWIRAHPGLLTLGRQGLFAHDNTHHALVMGAEAAEAISDDLVVDDRAWEAARRSFRDHVVED